jgi:hypothetical protein
MQVNEMQFAALPFMKLVQANMELLTKFSMSPEVFSQSLANAQSVFQGQGPAATVLRANAYVQLLQGLFKNYTECLTELSESGMSILKQSQAAMTRNG